MIYLANYIKADAYAAGKILPMSISFHFEEETLPVPIFLIQILFFIGNNLPPD